MMSGQDAVHERSTLQALGRRALGAFGDRPAIEYEGRWYGWDEFRHVAHGLVAALRATGAGPREPVAFLPRNRPSAVAALIGLIADARTIQMVYAFQSPSAIVATLERLRPGIVVAAADDLSPEVVEHLDRAEIAAVALREMDASALPGHARTTPCAARDVADPQIQILTSGTTGPPKQYPFPYDLFARHHALPGMLAAPGRDWFDETPVLLTFPLGNITGMYSTLPTMLRGQRAVLVDRFGLAAWHDWVVRFRPTNGGLPPAGIQMILDADIPQADLASIRFVGTGAAPLDPTIQRAFEARYGIPILLSYGATEFGGPVVAQTPELLAAWGRDKVGSVGRPMPGVRIRVVGADDGTPLDAGREGLLEVVSPRIGPEWIRTADVAVIDADGFVFLRGRADGAIMRGGFKLLPEPIERVLALHPAIAAAAVVAREDRRLSEVPVAAIQLRPGAAPPADADLDAHVRRHLPATHVPVAWRIVDDIPKNRSMKLDRPAIRAMLA